MESSRKRPGVALLLGLLFFGLGHAYAGWWRTGLSLAVAGPALVVAGIVFGPLAGVPLAWLVWTLVAASLVIRVAQALWAMRLARKAAVQSAAPPGLVLAYVACIAMGFVPLDPLRDRVETFRVPAGSMLPAIAVGDHIVVAKNGDEGPRPGQLVVFRAPVDGTVYVKRVVALGGEDVMVRGGALYVNGEQVTSASMRMMAVSDRISHGTWYTFDAAARDETLDGHTYVVLHDPSGGEGTSDWGPEVVPRGHFFVLGDNRDHSIDSRQFGPVPLEDFVGRADSVWWSSGPDGPRLDRIGLSL